jgi:ABC-type antimicrobial peptide transport system permease subunit
VIAVITGIIAGLYPAFYLSAFKPITVLKGKFSNSLGAISFRKVLVVFQFIISAALIIASLIIGKQMTYMRTKDLGFQKDPADHYPIKNIYLQKVYILHFKLRWLTIQPFPAWELLNIILASPISATGCCTGRERLQIRQSRYILMWWMRAFYKPWA